MKGDYRETNVNGLINNEIERYVSKHPVSYALHKKASCYLPGGSSRAAAYFDPYPFL